MDITKSLSNEEITINVCGGEHIRVKNLGESTVYVSKYPDIIIDNDNVIEIPSGCIDGIPDVCQYQIIDGTADWYGTIYAKSDGETKIEIRTQNNSNFRQIVKGGGDLTEDGMVIEYVEELPENIKQNTIYLVNTENGYLEYAGSKPLGYLEFPETPEIIIQPINCTGNIGDTVIFRVGAIGENLTYQWQYSKDNSSWYKATSEGNTTDTLTITIRSSIYENYYRCVIIDTDGNQIVSDTVRVQKEE